MVKQIVIVGGGFGGLSAARSLGNCVDIDVKLIDRRNYHLFQPLLYQVAMAGLSPAEIAVPIRSLVSKFRNIEVVLDNVQHVDLKSSSVVTDLQAYKYDYLILGCGAKHSYFGNEQWEPFAPGLKTLEQATEIRRRVLMAFELAERETSIEKKRELLTFVVVGGGPTGVELAGAVGEISRYTLSKDFRNIDPNSARVILIEAGPSILSSFDRKLSKYATRSLEKLGVQVWTSSRVTQISDTGVSIGDEVLRARTILWAAGVQASSINQSLGVELESNQKVPVNSDLSLNSASNVFVIGDQAQCLTSAGKPLPGLAPVALQQGRLVAKNILSDMNGKKRREFQYVDKGQMATIGRKRAVLQFRGLRLRGFIAWLAWLFVHIYFLIGFKNRFFVFCQWTWSYFTYSRGARLIVHKEWKSFLRRN